MRLLIIKACSLVLLFFFGACKKNQDTTGYLYFEGYSGKQAILYKKKYISKEKFTYLPIKKIETNTKTLLSDGYYILVNDCSSYHFQKTQDQDTHIFLNEIHFIKNQNSKIKDGNIHTICFHPLDKHEIQYKDKETFDVLPGKNLFYFSGKKFEFAFSSKKFYEENINISQIIVLSSIHEKKNNFFVTPIIDKKRDEIKKNTIKSDINTPLWVVPGKYEIEINGTKQIVTIFDHENQEIQLGAIKIETPKNFPFKERLLKGGQSIFAYINGKVLFNLDYNYSVFPGQYKVSLDGSDLSKNVSVEPNRLTVVKTLGAQIDPIDVSKDIKNFLQQNVTIHTSQQPFILMTIPIGLPFLVFNDKYEFGIEGVKGIYKSLGVSTEGVKKDYISFVKIHWELKYSNSHLKTNFVRIESKSPGIYGKTVDLLSYKPNDVYLPSGSYIFTYFTGENNSQNQVKSKIDVDLSDGIQEVSVPFYVKSTYEKEPAGEGKEREPQNKNHITIVPLLQ